MNDNTYLAPTKQVCLFYQFTPQELEETIESLKTQVNALQQKSLILQEEIEMGRKYTSTVRSPSRN